MFVFPFRLTKSFWKYSMFMSLQPNSLKMSWPGTAKYCGDAWKIAGNSGCVSRFCTYLQLPTYIYIYIYFFVYMQIFLFNDPTEFEAFGPLWANIFHLPSKPHSKYLSSTYPEGVESGQKNTTWLCDMANIQHESNINPRTLRFYIPSTLGSLWIYTYIYMYIYIYRYTCIIYIYTYLYAVLPFPLASSVLRLPENSLWRFPPVLQVWSHEPTFHQNLQCIYAFHVQFTHTHTPCCCFFECNYSLIIV